MDAWLAAMANGMTEFQVAFGFAASAEREAIRIRQNYVTYLNRQPSQQEVDAYVTLFVQGVLTNEDVVARFIGSLEYYLNPIRGNGRARDWVVMAYQQVLGRTPAQAEIDAWVTFLTSA